MVGRAERLLRVDLHPARQVDQREEDVAELVEALTVARRDPQLVELLADLLPHAVDGVPIPPQRGCALLDLPAARKRRQRAGDPTEGTVGLLSALGPLIGLDRLPVAEDLLDTVDLDAAEDVGMAAHDLAGDRSIHVGEIEGPLFRGELRVQDDLEQEVAELIGEIVRAAALDRVDRFVRLLEEVWPKRQVRLAPVPGATVGRTQAGADRRHPVRAAEVVDRIEGRHEPVVRQQRRLLEVAEGGNRAARQRGDRMRRGVERGQHGARPASSVAAREGIARLSRRPAAR